MSLAFEAKSVGALGLRALSLSALLTTLIKPLISDVELLSNEFFYKLKLLYQVLQSPIPHRALSLLNKDTFWFISNKSLLYLTPLPRNPFRYTLSTMCYCQPLSKGSDNYKEFYYYTINFFLTYYLSKKKLLPHILSKASQEGCLLLCIQFEKLQGQKCILDCTI